MIELDHDVLGKPADLAEARAMLRRLAGREHRVLTAVAVVCSARAVDVVALSTAVVRMKPFDEQVHERYLASGESLGKAGAIPSKERGVISSIALTEISQLWSACPSAWSLSCLRKPA